jgi:CspA family cold shock protein
MATGIIQIIWNRGTAIIGRGKRSELGNGVQDPQGTSLAATGTIRTLRDRGFGSIARDTHSKRADVFFHRSAVTGDGIDQLREGQPVSFEEEADPRDRNRQRAVNIHPLAGSGDT